VAPGTVVELVYPVLSLPSFAMQSSDAVVMLSHYLSGRNPRLELLVSQEDDHYLLVIIIDEVEERVFPSGEPAGGPPIGSVEVVLSADGAVVGIDARPSGSPPLETLRYNERNGVIRYSILGSSEEFRAIEEAWHQTLEDRRRDPVTGVSQGSD
jgi:hypothetical protein